MGTPVGAGDGVGLVLAMAESTAAKKRLTAHGAEHWFSVSSDCAPGLTPFHPSLRTRSRAGQVGLGVNVGGESSEEGVLDRADVGPSSKG